MAQLDVSTKLNTQLERSTLSSYLAWAGSVVYNSVLHQQLHNREIVFTPFMIYVAGEE
jgi:hypothetical protein